MKHGVGRWDHVAGVDDRASAENTSCEHGHREIVRRPTPTILVELIVHRGPALRALRPDQVAALFEHDDLVTGLAQQARGGGASATRADDADFGGDFTGRRFLRKVDDRARHGAAPTLRSSDGPG